MRYKRWVRLRDAGVSDVRWSNQDFPLIQRMVVPVLLLLCVLVVGL